MSSSGHVMARRVGLRHLSYAARFLGTRHFSAEASSAAARVPPEKNNTNGTISVTEPIIEENVAAEAAATSAAESTSASAGHDASKQHPHYIWSITKALLTGSLVVGAAASAYISYAYTTEEVSNKVAQLRASAEGSNVETNGAFQLQGATNFIESTIMKGVASIAGIYLDTRKSIEDQIRGFAAPTSDKLLPDLLPQERHVYTLVLDLNETLVYSDWTRDRGWRTFKRPGAEAFLEHLAQYYELVVYTDQLPFTVDPILEKLDQKGAIRYRLAREATQYINGKHYKDLSKLNRDPARVMFLSAHAKETCLQPENSILVKPWKLEPDDTTLLDLLPFLEYVARYRPADIRSVLSSYDGHDIPSEFLQRTKDYQRKMREVKSQNPFFRSSRS